MTQFARGRADYLELGDWNAQCFQCGKKFKASTLLKHWQGYYVCREHWEPRQPQDFVRGVQDIQTPPWVQPWPANSYVVVCAPNDQTAYPGFAIPSCVKPGFISPLFDPTFI